MTDEDKRRLDIPDPEGTMVHRIAMIRLSRRDDSELRRRIHRQNLSEATGKIIENVFKKRQTG